MSVIGLDDKAKTYIDKVCKMGYGASCCKYLVMGTKGFECMKTDPKSKKVIDDDWAKTPHVAQSDNCKGFGVEEQEQERKKKQKERDEEDEKKKRRDNDDMNFLLAAIH